MEVFQLFYVKPFPSMINCKRFMKVLSWNLNLLIYSSFLAQRSFPLCILYTSISIAFCFLDHRSIDQSVGLGKTGALDGALPLPLMRPATLYRQPEHTEEKRKYKRPDTPSPVRSASLDKAKLRRRKRVKLGKVRDNVAATQADSSRQGGLTSEEKLEINEAIEKQKYEFYQ